MFLFPCLGSLSETSNRDGSRLGTANAFPVSKAGTMLEDQFLVPRKGQQGLTLWPRGGCAVVLSPSNHPRFPVGLSEMGSIEWHKKHSYQAITNAGNDKAKTMQSIKSILCKCKKPFK